MRRVILYGLAGGVLLVLLKLLEYKHFVHAYPTEIYGRRDTGAAPQREGPRPSIQGFCSLLRAASTSSLCPAGLTPTNTWAMLP